MTFARRIMDVNKVKREQKWPVKVLDKSASLIKAEGQFFFERESNWRLWL